MQTDQPSTLHIKIFSSYFKRSKVESKENFNNSIILFVCLGFMAYQPL